MTNKLELNTLLPINIELSTLAILIAGLYVIYSYVDSIAIPEELWVEVAKEIAPYLKNWDYDKHTFEQWIQHNLLVIPKVMCTEEDIQQFKTNDVYLEKNNGNAVLIITFGV